MGAGRLGELAEAIVANPDDDDLRLVYADALAEDGDIEHAEFIQGEIALARAKPEDATLDALRTRVDALRDEHGKRFAGAIAEHAKEWSFERGLVSSIGVDVVTLASHADVLLGTAPVHSIAFWPPTVPEGDTRIAYEATARVAACPHLARIKVIRNTNHWMTAGSWDWRRAARRLLLSPHLTSLETLRVDTACRLVAHALASAHLPALRSLSFESSYGDGNDLGDKGALALARSALCARLDELAIYGADVGVKGISALALGLRNIRRLTVAGIWYHTNHLGPAGARALAQSEGLSNLELLQLGGAGIEDEGLEALAATPWLANVTELDLSDNALTDRGLLALAAAPNARRLERLNLRSGGHFTYANEVSASGVRALEALPRLREVCLAWKDGDAQWLPLPLSEEALATLST